MKEKLKFYQNDIVIFNPEQLIFIDGSEGGLANLFKQGTFRTRS